MIQILQSAIILLRKSQKAWCSELSVDYNQPPQSAQHSWHKQVPGDYSKILYNISREQACKVAELHLQKSVLETMKTKVKTDDEIN